MVARKCWHVKYDYVMVHRSNENGGLSERKRRTKVFDEAGADSRHGEAAARRKGGPPARFRSPQAPQKPRDGTSGSFAKAKTARGRLLARPCPLLGCEPSFPRK